MTNFFLLSFCPCPILSYIYDRANWEVKNQVNNFKKNLCSSFPKDWICIQYLIIHDILIWSWIRTFTYTLHQCAALWSSALCLQSVSDSSSCRSHQMWPHWCSTPDQCVSRWCWCSCTMWNWSEDWLQGCSRPDISPCPQWCHWRDLLTLWLHWSLRIQRVKREGE